MFVQLNPEVNSYSETLSTLKFAERASGVELGAAKSSKDGRDVRELMEQVVFILFLPIHIENMKFYDFFFFYWFSCVLGNSCFHKGFQLYTVAWTILKRNPVEKV